MTNSDPQLFPYLLLRIAGGPLADFQRTDAQKSYDLATELYKEEKEAEKIKEDLVDHLYTSIPTITDDKMRRLLIRLKRDIHNGRSIPYLSKTMLGQLPDPLQAMLIDYLDFTKHKASLEKEGEHLYEAETHKSKHAFTALLKQSNFQNGLLLSSDTAMASLKKYLASDAANTPSVSKKERSFMEYLSRMYAKPTPFGTFTHLAIASFGTDNLSPLAAPIHPEAIVESHVQLNNELLRYLSGLLVTHSEIRQHLPIATNFTIHEKGAELCFLVNNHNRESFQYIGLTPSLKAILALAVRRHWTYKTLIKEIVDNKYVAAPEKAIQSYVDQLLDAGFFEFDLGVSGMERDWATKLAEILSPHANSVPVLKKLVDDLKTLQKLASQYQKADARQRARLLQQAYELYRDSCMALGATDTPAVSKTNKAKEEVFQHTYDTVFRLKPHQMWYEDTALNQPLLLPAELKQNLESLGSLLALMSSFDTCLEKRESMTHFFKTTYGVDVKVGLLEFYRAYYRQENEHKTTNPLTKAREAGQRIALESLIKNIEDQLHNDDIRLNEAHIPNLPAPAGGSFAAFFHVYKNDNAIKVVLNDVTPGHGKLFGRFLYLFADDVTKQLRLWSTSHDGDAVMAEATDASVLNANLHDRIMPYEIHTPGGHTTLPASSQIGVHELEVSYDATDKRLVLTHPESQKEVIVFDLGFETPRQRSKLYTLLGSFMSGSHHPIEQLVASINEGLQKRKAEGTPVVLPRITYKDQIVLQRKAWLIPKDQLPRRNSGESSWLYFLRLYKWKEQQGMPHEVFVKTDFEKPQYISFRNPLLVALLESLINTVHNELKIEEMLPHSGQLQKVNGEKRVTELLCQWHIT